MYFPAHGVSLYSDKVKDRGSGKLVSPYTLEGRSAAPVNIQSPISFSAVGAMVS